MKNPTGEDIARGFELGDHHAVAAVNQRVQSILRFHRLAIPEQDQADLRQEVVAQLWQAVRREDFDLEAGFWGFVEVVTARRVIDWLRTLKPVTSLEGVRLEAPGDPQLSALSAERRKLAETALSALDESCRELIRLRISEGRSYRNLAAILGRSEGTLRVQFSRCIANARKQLDENATAPKIERQEEPR